MRRLYCLPFIPSGFYGRLMTRILSDKILNERLKSMYHIEINDNEQPVDSHFKRSPFKYGQWRCWQTGIELKYLDYTVLCVKGLINDPLQIPLTSTHPTLNLFIHNSIFYRDCENELKTKNYKQCSFLECYISYRDYTVDENLVRIFADQHVHIKLFAYICEIIDNLLEDWYPDLGTRFMQDSKGLFDCLFLGC